MIEKVKPLEQGVLLPSKVCEPNLRFCSAVTKLSKRNHYGPYCGPVRSQRGVGRSLQHVNHGLIRLMQFVNQHFPGGPLGGPGPQSLVYGRKRWPASRQKMPQFLRAANLRLRNMINYFGNGPLPLNRTDRT